MAEPTWKDIPKQDLDAIKKRLVEQISSMNEAELRIVAKSESSLAHFIAGAFQAVAKLIGYIIAYPIALATKVVESFSQGISDGWDAAFRDVK